MEQTNPAWASVGRPLSIAELRNELGLSLAEMGARIGVSKSQMHDIERRNAATLRVALALETMAPGRIDAAAICEDVRLARHGAGDSANLAEVSQGKAGENFPPCGQHQSSPGTPPTGGAAPGGDGSASGESREQDQLPGRADCHTEARSGEGLAPEGTSGGSAGLRSGSPANASQSAGASAAAIVAKRDGSGASCADDMPEAAE